MVKQPTGQRLTRVQRVRSAEDFARVQQRKLHVSDEVLVMNGAKNGLAITRLGLAVSRAVGNAVVRNRWKRLIRDAFRRSREQLPTGLDLVVRPRRGAAPDHAAIQQSLVRLAAQLARRVMRDKP